MNLRWIERDGKMRLQQEVWTDWPGTKEKGWEDVPTHQEPKKVSDELESVVLKAAEYDPRLLWHESVAKATIEFFKARMPESLPNYYYQQAIKDVRQALFGEGV